MFPGRGGNRTAVRKYTEVSMPMLAGGVDSTHVSYTKNEGVELNPIYNGVESILILLVAIICWKWN